MSVKGAPGIMQRVYDFVRFVGTNAAQLCAIKSPTPGHQGAVSIRKTVLPGMAIPMLKIRRPNGRLIFNMEITIRR